MKRYLIYIMTFVAALLTSCTNDMTDTPEMVDVGKVSVEVSVKGDVVNLLNLSSSSQSIVVDVKVNNNIYWTPVADQPWCQIVAEEHRGSGAFTINIERNDSFDDRKTANIKFVAGQYEQHILTVNHYGNVFITDKPYSVAAKGAGSASISVKCKAGIAWRIEGDNWLTATKGQTSDDGGFVTTIVDIAWSENTDSSRYGTLEFVVEDRDIADGKFSLWQYGSELNYDNEGHILLPAQDVAPLELRVPESTIKSLVLPNWVTAVDPTNNGDGTISYMLEFTDNLSDAEFIRPSQITLEMQESGVANIALPLIRQEFYSIGGLLTGAGMQLFAQRWNEGGDISNWCIDGVPTIVGDVDMSLVEVWTPIGTENRPFNIKFNGGGFEIKHLNASAPIFGYCNDAEISNVIIDESCNFVQKGDFGATINLAPLALEIAGASVVSQCKSEANITVDGSSTTANYISHLGGLVVSVEEGAKVSECEFRGNITTVANGQIHITAADNSYSYVGGLVSKNAGIVEKCHSEGEFNFNAYSRYIQMGGVVGTAEATSLIDGNINYSTLNYASARIINGIGDISRYAYIGGIVGGANGTISNNEHEGDIISTSNIKLLNIGGIAGMVNTPGVVFQHNSVANRADLKSIGAARYAYIGALIGYLYNNLTIDFTEDLGSLNGMIYVHGMENSNTAIAGLGGIVGYLDGSKGATANLIAPKWGGKITIDLKDAAKAATVLCAGGIVGYATGELTITGAESNGDNITIQALTNTYKLNGPSSIGGILGYSTSKVNISESVNNTPVTWNSYNAKSNGIPAFAGGIVGCITGNTSSITNCHNTADVINLHYNNNAYTTVDNPQTLTSTACATGGIIGSFGQYLSTNGTLSISGCTNTATVDAYRACVGGIAGYINRTECSNCSFSTGHIGEQASTYAGGIVGLATESTISDSWATTNIKATQAGSCNSCAGGIAGMTLGEVTITGCKYFGTLTNGTTTLARPADGEHAGGIVGVSDKDCTISNCKFGGKIVNELDSTMNVSITSDNYMNYVVGISSTTKATCPTKEIVNCGYWDGSSQE